jgi:hypothetical protein
MPPARHATRGGPRLALFDASQDDDANNCHAACGRNAVSCRIERLAGADARPVGATRARVQYVGKTMQLSRDALSVP